MLHKAACDSLSVLLLPTHTSSRTDFHILQYRRIPTCCCGFGIEREDSMLAAEASRGELLQSDTAKMCFILSV